MNVVFQMIVNMPGLKEFFLSGQFLVDSNSADEDGGLLCDQFATLFRTYHFFKDKVLDPKALKKYIAEKCQAFNLDTQEDAHEFILYVINTLSEEMNKASFASPTLKKKKTNLRGFKNQRTPVIISKSMFQSVENAADKVWNDELQKCCSICTDLLMGQIMSEVECRTCKHANRVFQVFYVLELPLPQKSEITLKECLNFYGEEEIIPKSEEWKCENCREVREASKRSSIVRLPKILMIHYKRFVFKDKKFVRNKCIVDLSLEGETISVLNGPSKEYIPFSVIVALVKNSIMWAVLVLAITLVVFSRKVRGISLTTIQFHKLTQ